MGVFISITLRGHVPHDAPAMAETGKFFRTRERGCPL